MCDNEREMKKTLEKEKNKEWKRIKGRKTERENKRLERSETEKRNVPFYTFTTVCFQSLTYFPLCHLRRIFSVRYVFGHWNGFEVVQVEEPLWHQPRGVREDGAKGEEQRGPGGGGQRLKFNWHWLFVVFYFIRYVMHSHSSTSSSSLVNQKYRIGP